jgi:hypothetical protein
MDGLETAASTGIEEPNARLPRHYCEADEKFIPIKFAALPGDDAGRTLWNLPTQAFDKMTRDSGVQKETDMISNGSGYRTAGIGLATLMTVVIWSAPAQGGHAARRRVTLDVGTVIPVRLKDRLSSKDSQQGDKFTAIVQGSNDDPTDLPAGTKIEGTVRKVEAKNGKNPGMLDISFDRIVMRDGRSYSISGAPIDLNSKSVIHRNGRIIAKSGHNGPNRESYVGIGAGAGLLVNVLGHRTGTLRDTLIGGGLGYLAGSLIKSGSSARDVELKEGTKLGVRLRSSVTINR